MHRIHPARRPVAATLLAIFLLAAACGPRPTPQGNPATGQALWAQLPCFTCHGANAQGTARGPALAGTPLNLTQFLNIVRRGGPGMPHYPAGQIADQNVQDLYAWVESPAVAQATTPVAVPPTAPVAPSGPTPTTIPAGAQGQQVYVQAGCGACHGATAQGGIARPLAGISIPFTFFQSAVRNGRGGMPPYSTSQISDSDLQAMYTWLQSLP